MDDRKRTIKALEEKKRETQKAAHLIFEQLGEQVLVRMKAQGMTHLPEMTDYCRLLQDRSESEAVIRGIETDIGRMKTLQNEIAAKEQERSRQTKLIQDYAVRLGEILLDHPELDPRYGADKQEIAQLIPKIQSLETRLEQLADGNNTHIFGWIGRNAQTMVIQSLLETSQERRRRIYERLGEQYMRSEGGIPEAEAAIAGIQGVQGNAELLAEDLGRLKTACRKIGDTFGPDGNPYKRIQVMEKHIALIKEELRKLCTRVGTQAAQAGTQGTGAETTETVSGGAALFAEALDAEAAPLLAEAEALRQARAQIETQIEKIKAAISIDDKQAEIKKLHKAVTQHRRRIAASEQSIRELEDQITQARQHIEDLTRRL